MWYSEIHTKTKDVATANRKPQEEECMTFDDIMERDDTVLPSDIDLYVAGPPCQGFSVIGKRLGGHDERFQVMIRVLDTIQNTRPKSFIVENVKISCPVAKKKLAELFDGMRVNYVMKEKILDSKDFSPQCRKRYYVVGVRMDVATNTPLEFNFPDPLNSPPRIQDIIDPTADASPALWALTDYQKRVLERHTKRHLKFSEDMHVINIGSSVNFGGCKMDGTVPTITKRSRHYMSVPGRKLSPVELARVQGIPDTMNWNGASLSHIYAMIGNGMQVNTLAAIIEKILLVLRRS